MPKASPLRSSFNSGELSPLLDGRVDIAKYANGCKVLENFIPSVQGPAVRRAGTRFVAEVKDSTKRTWLARFEFSVDQVFILEFGEYYVRFYTQRGVLLDDTGLAPYEKVTPYSAADLITSDNTFALSMVQSGDIIYIAHPNYPVYRLARYANTNWTMDPAVLKNGPFKDQNPDKRIKVYTNQNASDFVSNGQFLQNINGWTVTTGSGSTVVWTTYGSGNKTKKAGGRKQFYKGTGTTATSAQTLTGLTIGTAYTVVLDTNGKITMKIGTAAGLSDYVNATVSTKKQATNTYTFTPTGTTAYVTFTNANADDKSYSYVNSIQVGGIVTLTASEALFDAKHVGALFYMEPSDLSTIKPWTSGEEFTNSNPPLNALRRSDGKTYVCTTSGTPTAGKVWRTGGDKPTHTYGTQSDGSGNNGLNGTNVEKQGLDWKYLDSGYAILQITAFTSSTVVQAKVVSEWDLPQNMGVSTPTFRWAFGAFSDYEGYPSQVTFFRERLTFAKGQNIYLSVAGDFENFAKYNDSGNVVADRAVNIVLSSDEVNTIQWLVPQQSLLIGTAGYEFALGENASGEAFGPGNTKIEQQTSDGSKSVRAARVGYSTLFVQRSGRKLKELAYNFQMNGYVSADMTVLSEHVTGTGIQQIAWHKEPYLCLWAVRADGQLLGFTFNKEQDVVGWHRHIVGSGVVESIAVIPKPDKTRDDLWLIVNRTINGTTKRYVEYLEGEYKIGDTQASCFYVDCGLTYSGAAATTISGLSHLEGKTVQVLADGSAHPDCVVTSGQITLQRAASIVNVGLAYTSNLQTVRLEAGAADGTSQGKMKRINKVVLRFLNTLGGKAGPNSSTLDTIQFRSGSDKMDSPPPLFTGDKLMEWPNGYDFDGYIYVQQNQPLPMTLVAAMPQVHTFDR